MQVTFLSAYGEYAEGDTADVADEVAQALIAGGIAQAVEDAEDAAEGDEAKTKKVMKSFENSLTKQFESLKKEFKKDITEDITKSIEKKFPHGFSVTPEVKEKNFGFKSLGDFAQSVWREAKGNSDDANRMKNYRGEIQDISRKASYLNTSDDSVFVPHQFGDSLWNNIPDYPKWYTEGLTFKTDSLNFDAPFIDDTSRSGEAVGGFSLSWTAEYNQLSLTKPNTNKSQLKLKKLTGLFQLTEEVKKTPYNISAVVDRVAEPAFVNKLNSARFFGAGSTEPIGQLTSGNGNLYTINRAVANKVTLPDLLAMDAAANDMSGGSKFVYLYSPSVEQSLFSMTFPNNAGTVPALMPNNGYMNSAAFGKSKTLMSRDAYKCPFMKKLGFKADIALVNVNNFYCLRPQSDAVQVDVSMHLLFDRATDTIRWITWYDCGPCQTSYLTLSDGSTIVSDAIVLSTYT